MSDHQHILPAGASANGTTVLQPNQAPPQPVQSRLLANLLQQQAAQSQQQLNQAQVAQLLGLANQAHHQGVLAQQPAMQGMGSPQNPSPQLLQTTTQAALTPPAAGNGIAVGGQHLPMIPPGSVLLPATQTGGSPVLQLPSGAKISVSPALAQLLSPGSRSAGGAQPSQPLPQLSTAAMKQTQEQGASNLASILAPLSHASQSSDPLLPPPAPGIQQFQHNASAALTAPTTAAPNQMLHMSQMQGQPQSTTIVASNGQQPPVLREQHVHTAQPQLSQYPGMAPQGGAPHQMSNQHVAGVAGSLGGSGGGAGMLGGAKPVNPLARTAAVEKEALQHMMQQKQMMMLLQERQQQAVQEQMKQQEMRKAMLGQTLAMQTPQLQQQHAQQQHAVQQQVMKQAQQQAQLQQQQHAVQQQVAAGQLNGLAQPHPAASHASAMQPTGHHQPQLNEPHQLHSQQQRALPDAAAATLSPSKAPANTGVSMKLADALAAHLAPVRNQPRMQYMMDNQAANIPMAGPSQPFMPAQPPSADTSVEGVLAPPPPSLSKPAKAPPKPPANKNPRSWLVIERDALRRVLLLFGIGRWSTLHTGLLALHKTCEKTEAEVQDACWHLVQCLEEFVMVPDDKTFLQQLQAPIADRGKITTPGAAWTKLNGTMVKRLKLLEEIRNAMALLQQPAVYGTWLAAVTGISDQGQPSSWWDVKCDLGLLFGCWKHGYANYDEMKKDPEYTHIFANPDAPPATAGGSDGGADGAAAAAAAPSAETLTKRYRRLLDMVFRAQKTSAAAVEKAAKEAEKAAKEAEKAAREAERAARDAEERSAREVALRKHMEDKAARAAQRRKAATDASDLREQSRRVAAEGGQDGSGQAGEGDVVGHSSRGRRMKRALDEDEYMLGGELEEELGSPAAAKQKKPKTYVPRPAKNPDDLTAKQVSELIKLLMTWGLPLHLDWPAAAAATPPLSVPTPKPIKTGKAAATSAQPAGDEDKADGEDSDGDGQMADVSAVEEGGGAEGQGQDGGAGGGGGGGDAAAQQGQKPAQFTAPVTDRAQAVTNLISGLHAILALPARVSDALTGTSVTAVWAQVASTEQMCGAIREACPALATRSDKCLLNVVLDCMADMQDVEEATTRKKPLHAAPANKTLKHPPTCSCAVCTRVRNAAARRKQAAQGGDGGEAAVKEGGEDEQAAGSGDEGSDGGEEEEHEGEQPTGPAPDTPGAGAAATSNGHPPAPGAEDGQGDAGAGEHEVEDDGQGKQEVDGGGAGSGKARGGGVAKPVVPPTLRVLTSLAASRLRERITLLMSLHAGTEALKPIWQEQPSLMNRMGELPAWWAPTHDGQLAAGVLKHGFGEWSKVFEDPACSFMSAQQDFVNRQLARRAAARAIQAGGAQEEGAEQLSPEEVESLAALPEDAPVVAAGLPGQPALVKRCRQISTVMLRFLRKEKYLAQELARKKRKHADADGGDAGGEGGGSGKKGKPGAGISAEAWAIAMDVMASTGAPAPASGGAGAAAPAPAPKRGRKPGKAAAPLSKQEELKAEALRTEALKIALEVMVKTGREPSNTGGASTQDNRTASQPGAVAGSDDEEAAEEEEEEATEGATEVAPVKGRKLLSTAQSPAVKAAAKGGRKQGRGKAAGDGEAGEGSQPVKKPRAPRKPKAAAATDAGMSDLAMQIALEAAAAAGGVPVAAAGRTAGKAAASKVGQASSLAQGTSMTAATGLKTASLGTGAGSNATLSAADGAGAAGGGGVAEEVTSPGAAAGGKGRKRGGGGGGRGAGAGRGAGRGGRGGGRGAKAAGAAAGGDAVKPARGRPRKKAAASAAEADEGGDGAAGGPSSSTVPTVSSSHDEDAEEKDVDEGIAGVFNAVPGHVMEEEEPLLFMQLDRDADIGHALLEDPLADLEDDF